MAYWKTDSACWASIKLIGKVPTASTGDCGRSMTASVGASCMLHQHRWVVSLQLRSFLSVYCNLKRLKLDCFHGYFLKSIINRKVVLNFVVTWGTSVNECQYTFWQKVGLLVLLHCLSNLGTIHENSRWKTALCSNKQIGILQKQNPHAFFGSVNFLSNISMSYNLPPVLPPPAMHMHTQLCVV